MERNRFIFYTSIFLIICAIPMVHAKNNKESIDLIYTKEIEKFSIYMEKKHKLDKEFIKNVLSSAKYKHKIIKLIRSPAEKKTFRKYMNIFLTEKRIKKGIDFHKKHMKALKAVEEKYKIPSEIIVSIIGVETFYGERVGNFRAIDSLSTLAFTYKRRSSFFRSELEKFFLLIRREDFSYNEIYGSYAGALGVPQFMPSSYLRYARDHDLDGKIDLWKSYPDIFASVANYLKEHGWEYNNKPLLKVKLNSTYVKKMFLKYGNSNYIKLDKNIIKKHIKSRIEDNSSALYLVLLDKNKLKYYIGSKNFYVITRYNRSTLYATAIIKLSQKIKEGL